MIPLFQTFRWLSRLVVPALLLCLLAGCGGHVNRSSSVPRVQASSAAPSVDERAAVAARFATTALSYNSTSQTPTAFIDALAPIITSAERIRLEGSSRAGLNWPALQARGEQATAAVVSVTSARPPEVVVEVQRTTTTTFATVTEPVELRLQMARVDASWRISQATGGGL